MLSLSQKNKRWRIVSIFVILTMLATVLPLAQPAANSAFGADKPITVTVRVEADEGTLLNEEVTLSYTPLESYGFAALNQSQKDVGYITPLQTLAEAYEQVSPGSAVTELSLDSSAFINTISGSNGSLTNESGWGWMFYVNNRQPMNGADWANINNFHVREGDEIVIYGVDFYQTDFYYGYFENRVYHTEVGDPLTVKLMGENVVEFMWDISPLASTPYADASILTNQDPATGNPVGDAYEDSGVVTDANGEATLPAGTFTKPGTYVISAVNEDYAIDGYLLSRPCAKVVVYGAAPLPNYVAEWSTFRGNDGTGITSAKAARVAGEATQKWALTLDTAQWAAAGSPIIVGEKIFIAAKDKLLKISKTGTVEQSAPLAAAIGYSSFPTYGGGMIFVPLSGGMIQAFNADTMESLWISAPAGTGYTAETQLLYANGYLYGGVYKYNSATNTQGSFFAIDVTDDNLLSTKETKAHKWDYNSTATGNLKGYYWAGAAAAGTGAGNYIVFAGDDGILVSADPVSGAVKGSFNVGGSVRSGITYDSGFVYVTTKAGKLWKVAVATNGSLGGAGTQSAQLSGAESSATPVIYGGKVYAVSGEQFNIGRLDIFDTATLAKKSTTDLGAFTQSSPLLSKGYNGKVYLYFMTNSNKDDVIVVEDSAAKAAPIKSVLYSPGNSQAISSLIADNAGTLYFTDGAGKLNAIGSRNLSYDPIDDVHMVTFDANGGKGAPGQIQVINGTVFGAMGTPTRIGYVFDGWFTSASGGTKITADTKVTLSGDTTLYAHWKSMKIKVKFDVNGGKALKTKEKTVDYDAKIGALPSPTHKKSGSYGFIGWFTAKSGGAKVTANTVMKSVKNIIYYAHWGKKYTVKFNANKGKVKVKNKKFTSGLKYGSLPKATRTGYKFTGWYTKKSGGKKITASAIVTLKKNATYYAHWKKK